MSFEKTLFSALIFIFFCFLFMMYITGLYILFFFPLDKPITIYNLSLLSKYRYLLFSILSILMIFFSFKRKNLWKLLTFPYIKEEIYRILYFWNDTIFGNIFTFLIEKLFGTIFRLIYIIVHSIFFIFFRFLFVVLLVNFAFFSGDLRYILYLMPLSFFIWLLSFFDYYFDKFYKGSSNFIKSMVFVEIRNKNINLEKNQEFIKISPNNLSFSLTPLAFKENLTNIEIVTDLWFKYCSLDVFFSKYAFYKKNLNLCILFLQYFCWYAITLNIFISFW